MAEESSWPPALLTSSWPLAAHSGPGVITGAADDDPSGIGTNSQAGAAFGTGQLWLALYRLPLMMAVQEMCGRIGLITGKGIAALVRQQYSRSVLFGAVLSVLIANTINVGGDLGAMAATIQLLLPGVLFLLVLCFFALGMRASEVTSWFILFMVGSTLYLHGVRTITSADQAPSALAPLVKTCLS